MSVKLRAIIWIFYFVVVVVFVVHAYKSGPGDKPTEKGDHSFVLVVPEDEEPPISHIPLERWRAWHMVSIERGDSTIERCMNCHEHEKFCDRCHSYVGVPKIKVAEKDVHELGESHEHEHGDQHEHKL